MRRTIVGAAGGILLLAAGFFFVQRQQRAVNEQQVEILREATVENGRVTATVNATGAIEPEALVTLTFGLGGTIQEVNVVRGQVVKAGDLLAQLDAAELELAVQQAEDALLIQQLTMAQRVNTQPSQATLATSQADIDAARANISVAEANLAAAEAAVLQAEAQKALLLSGSTPGQIAAAEAQVTSAQAQQQTAVDLHNQTMECFVITLANGDRQEECPGLGRAEEQARANLASADAALAAAQAQLADLKAGPRQADIQAADAAIASAQANVLAAQGNLEAAQANLARAEAALARLKEPPTSDEIAILEAQVAGAETNLALAQLRLQQARIVAPMAGTVANVLMNVGEQAAPGAPAVTIVDENAFHINVNVDEIDIDQIALNQAVRVTMDALPDTAVAGIISEIAPTSANTGGVVTYLVTINMQGEQKVLLRPGMSANAAIVVDEIDNVLVVPNWAVRLDRETGKAFVNVKRSDGSVEEVIIETGLRNEQFSEVVSGIQAGAVVVLTNERDGFNLFGN